MNELNNLAEWQKFMAKQIAENPDVFKKALLPFSKSEWKRQAQNELYAQIALAELIKGEIK